MAPCAQNSGPFTMPPEEQLAHLKASINLVQMESLPIRESGAITKKTGVMVQFHPHSSGKVPHPCFTRMKAEAELRMGKPIYRTTWDAPGWSGEGWFWQGDKRLYKMLVKFFKFHEVEIAQQGFWSGGE